jgi:hypothetical protein
MLKKCTMNYSKFAQQNTQNLHSDLLKKCTMVLENNSKIWYYLGRVIK